MAIERPVSATVDDPELLKRWLYNLWVQLDKPSSGINETNHAALGNLNSDSYTHLTALQAQGLATGFNTALHYHASDRDRANHSGTQVAATISDFFVAVQEAKRMRVFTVATLPGGAVQGDFALVTDAAAPAFLVAVVGGGAVVAPVFYNGAAWVAG